MGEGMKWDASDAYRLGRVTAPEFLNVFMDWYLEFREPARAPEHPEDLASGIAPALEGFAAGWSSCISHMRSRLLNQDQGTFDV